VTAISDNGNGADEGRRRSTPSNRGKSMRKQRGVSLIGAIFWMAIIGFVGVMAAKLLPAYIDYFAVRKMFAAMEQNGETKGTVSNIRDAYDRRNAIEDVKALSGRDLEISKAGGETVVTANWSQKVPLFSNLSACMDFVVSTEK
jgi:hypothetical protein